MRRLPPLAAVRVFEAAARHGNFTRAAAELGMTQAAVSYQVKLLEERIGTGLFHRIKGQVSLTDTGRRIAPMISSAFDGLDDAFGSARSQSESMLTISCSNSFAANWLAVRLGSFQLKRPGLAVKLCTDDHVVDFASSEVDVAIRNSADPWPGLVSHFLMRVPIAPLASPQFLAEHPPVTSPADVMRLPRLSPDDRWWKTWFAAVGGGEQAATPQGGIRLDSQIMEGNAAIAGQGAAILNLAMWRSDIAAGRLVRPVPDLIFSSRCYRLVYPEHKRGAPKVKAFRDWMAEQVAVEAADDPDGVFVPPSQTRA